MSVLLSENAVERNSFNARNMAEKAPTTPFTINKVCGAINFAASSLEKWFCRNMNTASRI